MLANLSPAEAKALATDWLVWARDNQLEPLSEWTYWLLLAGRGFGKTRTGAETLRMWARSMPYTAIVAPTHHDVEAICVRGESGVLSVCPDVERPIYRPHKGVLEWPNGAITFTLSADTADRIRGYTLEGAWVDELCSFDGRDAWDNLNFCMRRGERPRVIVTTTPKPTLLLKEIMQNPRTHLTRGTTYDNAANLSPHFIESTVSQYEGTRLGRQELYAAVLDDIPGALFQRSQIDRDRLPSDRLGAIEFARIVVAVDPAVSSEEKSDETGIVVAGVGAPTAGGAAGFGRQTGRLYVLEDASGRFAPREWARRAIMMARKWGAERIVAEKNQGGEMVAQTIRAESGDFTVELVHASKGKAVRAEPVSLLYEQGRVHHVGGYPELEEQLCMLTVDFDVRRQGFSPDRADALVWAITALKDRIRPGGRQGVVHDGWRQVGEQAAAQQGLTPVPGKAHVYADERGRWWRDTAVDRPWELRRRSVLRQPLR